MISSDEKKHPSKAKVHCVIFSAMTEELAYLDGLLSSHPFTNHSTANNFIFKIYDLNGYRVLLTPTGIGTAFSSAVISFVNAYFNIEVMLFIGTAGGIKDSLAIRDIILVDSAFEAESQNLFSSVEGTPFDSCLTHPLKNEKIKAVYHASPELIQIAESLICENIIKGSVVTSNAFPAPKELFIQLKKTEALAIDMETSAFYQVAWLFNIPALAIRAISNKLDYNGHDENIALSDLSGSIQAASNYVYLLIFSLAEQYLQKSRGVVKANL